MDKSGQRSLLEITDNHVLLRGAIIHTLRNGGPAVALDYIADMFEADGETTHKIDMVRRKPSRNQRGDERRRKFELFYEICKEARTLEEAKAIAKERHGIGKASENYWKEIKANYAAIANREPTDLREIFDRIEAKFDVEWIKKFEP